MLGSGFPVLVAQTPRAGRWNHVALLPLGGVPDGTDVAAFLSMGVGVGGNFVCVLNEVLQPTTGRTGREVLVLLGVQMPEGEKRVKLEAGLRTRLEELGRVIASWNWEEHPGGAAYLPELLQWRDQLVFELSLKAHTTENRVPLGSSASSRVGLWWPILAVATGTAILAAGLYRYGAG